MATYDEILEKAKKLTDEHALARLALHGQHWTIRKEAVKNPNLCDESVFEKVLVKENDDYVCFHAYRRLKCINPNSKLFINPRDVGKITDEKQLKEIIKHSIYRPPYITGGSRVHIGYKYPYLLCPDKRWKVRYEAAGNPNLTDEGFLKDIALKDYDLRVRCAAINNLNLNDEDFFCHVALNDYNYSVRCDVAEKIQNEYVLKQIVQNDNKSCVRVYAISNPNLKDQSFLRNLALNDYDYNVRMQAVLKINDDDVLREVFENDNHGSVKKTVCKCISDEDFLNHIANGRYKWALKRAAKSRLRHLQGDSSPKRKIKFEDLPLLDQFENLNTTCESIHDLGDLDVLIVLKDGTNLTSWEGLEDRSEVLFVSEDLSNQDNLIGKYRDMTGLKAIVTTEISDKVTSLENMFMGCFSLTDISSLKDWDVSNICSMKGMFNECNSLNDLSPLSGWNVVNVGTMNSMFENCFSLGSVSSLWQWKTFKLSDMGHMFDDCHSMEDIFGLKYWDVGNVENMEYLFCCCNYLKDIYYLKYWDISNVDNMAHMFDGCDYLVDFTPICAWDFDGVENTEGIFANCGMDEHEIFELFRQLDCEREVDLRTRYVPLG